MRKIQSFVRRSGRLTLGQAAGLGELWPEYGVEVSKKNGRAGLLDFDAIFAQIQPIVLEIGFGNGDSLLEMALSQPQTNFIGIEVYEAGIGRLINQAHKHQLSNLKIIKADAVEILKNNIADNSLNGFQLFFPDPWHKKKHHKRRLINTVFLDLMSQKLVQDATLHMATDWADYAKQMMAILTQHPHFKNTQNAYKYSTRPEYRPITKFEKRGKVLGHDVWDLVFRRC